jgi:hypothetical protein
MIQGHQLMPCLVPSPARYGIRKHAKFKTGQAHNGFPLKTRERHQPSIIDQSHNFLLGPLFYPAIANHSFQFSATNQHNTAVPFQFGQVCSAAPALAPCLKWVRRIDRRRLPLLTSLHSSLLLLISPTLSWTRISPLRDDFILNRVRLSLLPYLQLHLHLFQIVPLSFFYDH